MMDSFQENDESTSSFSSSDSIFLISDLIIPLHKENKKVSLVGVSAGGSAVINAYAQVPEKIVGVAKVVNEEASAIEIGNA